MVNRKLRSDPESYVYNILSKRDYSEGELRYKLKTKFDIEKEHIDDIISKLKKYDFVDDSRYKKLYSITKLRQGYGPFYISAKLTAKMIHTDPSEVQNIALSEGFDIEDIVREVCRKKIESMNFKKAEKDRKHSGGYDMYKKCFDFLCRRGFDMELSRRIAKEEIKYESDFS